jgi:hypothetical protein
VRWTCPETGRRDAKSLSEEEISKSRLVDDDDEEEEEAKGGVKIARLYLHAIIPHLLLSART